MAHRSDSEARDSHLGVRLSLQGVGRLEEVPDGALLGRGCRLLPLEAAGLLLLHLPAITGRNNMPGDE